MKIQKLCLFGLALTMLTGCINQQTLANPNTQTGAAVGAVAGSVIGGNVGDGSGSNVAGGAVLGAIAGVTASQVIKEEKPVKTGGWERHNQPSTTTY